MNLKNKNEKSKDDDHKINVLLSKYNSTFKSKSANDCAVKKLFRTNSGRLRTKNLVFTLQEFLNAEKTDHWYLKVDRDRVVLSINEAKKVYKQLKDDFDHYFNKTSNRENQIRDHISNLDYVHADDANIIKQDVEELLNNVLINVDKIKQKINFDLDEKRKDIENRINIRLIDSEYVHKILLDKKIQEQEYFMKTLHSFTTELLKIKNNYKNSKDQIVSIVMNNDVLIDNIKKNKKIYSKLINEMKNLKTVIFKLKNEIFLCYKLKNEEHVLEENEKELELKLKKIKDRNLYSGKNIYNAYQSNKSDNSNKLDFTKQGFFNNSKSNVFKNPIYKNIQIDLNNLPQQLLNFNKNYTSVKDLNKDVFLENLCKKSSVQEYMYLIDKYPNGQHIFKHLINKMKILKNKNNALKNMNTLIYQSTNELKSAIMKITSDIKENNYNSNKDKVIEAKELYIDKSFRKKFINDLVNNKTILDCFNDDKFQSVTFSIRKIYSMPK